MWRRCCRGPLLGKGPCSGDVSLHFRPSPRYRLDLSLCHKSNYVYYAGPVLAPIAGGFIAQSVGSKYIFIVTAAGCGVSAVIGIPLLRETYGPVVYRRHYRKLLDTEKASPGIAAQTDHKFEFIWRAMIRPVVLLFRSLICFMLSFYIAFISGTFRCTAGMGVPSLISILKGYIS